MSVRQLGPLALSCALALAAWPARAQETLAPPTSESGAPSPPKKDTTALPSTDWHLVGAIAAYSLAAVASGTFVYAEVRTRQISNDDGFQAYKRGNLPEQYDSDVCQGAKDGVVVDGAPSPDHIASLCSQADKLKVVGIVSVVTAIVGIGTGTALLLTRPSPEKAAVAREPRLALTPIIGVHGAAAQLDFRF